MKLPFGNRRKERGNESLEKGIRKSERRGSRWQAAWGTFFVLLFLGTAIYGARLGWRWTIRKLFTENSRFALQHIVVENHDGILSSNEIIKASGGQVGQNLFSIDLGQIRRDLELIPIIDRAEVRRELPDQLTLRVFERKPLLRFLVYFPTEYGVTRQQILYLDKTGHAIQLPVLPPEKAERYAQLPWITGLRATDVRVGKVVESSSLFDALTLLNEWETSTVNGVFPLTQIDVSRPNQLALVSTQGSVAVFTPPDFGSQLRRLTAILVDARAKQKIVRLADLSVKQNIPVTFRE